MAPSHFPAFSPSPLSLPLPPPYPLSLAPHPHLCTLYFSIRRWLLIREDLLRSLQLKPRRAGVCGVHVCWVSTKCVIREVPFWAAVGPGQAFVLLRDVL